MREDDIQPEVKPPQGKAPPCSRILVADDENAIRSLMSAVLLQAGYRAQDGAVAWAALQAEPYDLLITDCDMPKVTGIELVRNLRSARMDLPVILVTGALPWRASNCGHAGETIYHPELVRRGWKRPACGGQSPRGGPGP